MKRYCVLTLFPEIFPGPLGIGVIGRSIEKGRLHIDTINIRDYSVSKHKTVDEPPYGGGGGMVMKPEPLVGAINAARAQMPEGSPVILMSPQGEPFHQRLAQELAELPGLILLCGRYEGIDERARQRVDREISAGDFVVSGGEVPAMIVLDAVARLVPEVLGNPESAREESFQRPFVEYPQYTRPARFEGEEVPAILLSGDHAKVRRWRQKQSIQRTLERRPDLLEGAELTEEEQRLLAEIQRERNAGESE